MNDVAMFLAYINELATILRKHGISVFFGILLVGHSTEIEVIDHFFTFISFDISFVFSYNF